MTSSISGQRLPIWNGDAADAIPVEESSVVVIHPDAREPWIASSLSEKRALTANCARYDRLYLACGSHAFDISAGELSDLLDRRCPPPVKVELDLSDVQLRMIADVERRLSSRTSSDALQVSPQAVVTVSALLRVIIDQAARRQWADR